MKKKNLSKIYLLIPILFYYMYYILINTNYVRHIKSEGQSDFCHLDY